ncbi:MAG: divergent polysaccharide deacetylase family protein [Candidatus Hydrogenedentes bacterium]|nr:divergent polysaccharide deacetylase family protein [Candidatus Hydrogenedentota bacterium]
MTPPDEPVKGATPQTGEPPSPAHVHAPSWLAILVGVWAVVMAAGLCVILTTLFLRSRPIDLSEVMRNHIRDVESVLLSNHVPREKIAVSTGEARSDESSKWAYLECRVDVPSDLSLGGIVHVVRRSMARREVTVLDEASSPPGRIVLTLQDGGREFARMTLTGKPDKKNLHEATRRIAEESSALLTQVLQPPSKLTVSTPEARENETAEWTFTAMEIQLAAPLSAQAIETALAAIMHHKDTAVSRITEPAQPLALAYSVAYGEVECVLVTVHRAEPESAPSQEDAMRNSEDGSPEEGTSEDSGSEALPLDSEHLNGDARKPAPPLHKRPADGSMQVAIIVDDGGYGGSITEEVLALDPALTLSILPHAPHSTETARRAQELGFEVMLHMPMENSSEQNAYPGQLVTGMAPEDVQRLTSEALADVPGAVGINNHTGSKFTSDATSMRTFRETIKPLNLFFVDSRTMSTSTAYSVAQELDIQSAARDLFLDHESDKAYIRERFQQLIELCKTQGSAIGICHFRKNSAAVLTEMLPRFKEEGITLVHVSELVE